MMNNPNIDGNTRPIEDVLAELANEVPVEEWANVPTDLSSDLDHYLYGTPRATKTDTPNIVGGSRTVWTAAIVLICILLAGLAILIGLLSPSSEASAGLLVGASCFFPKG